MKLNQLSDQMLLKKMNALVEEERRLLGQVLWHLKEIDARKLYSDLQCSSLFDYCVKVLKYSESQASRRVSATRLLKLVPEIMSGIENGDLNLTHLNRAQTFFKDEKIKDPKRMREIIEKLKGKRIKEVDELFWKMKEPNKTRKTTIMIEEETLVAIKKVQNLKGHVLRDVDQTLQAMAKLALKEWDPGVVKRKTKVLESHTRFIPTQVRAAVWTRDQGQCQVCKSTYLIQYDHVVPFAMGGKTTIENLRLLCANCNQRKAIKDFPYQIGPKTTPL